MVRCALTIGAACFEVSCVRGTGYRPGRTLLCEEFCNRSISERRKCVKRVCVFCGSNAGARPAYAEAARSLGEMLARRGLGLVYGGGRVGLMGALANAARAAGGEVIGVIPESLVRKEVAHTGLEDLRVVGSMHERKAMMADLA